STSQDIALPFSGKFLAAALIALVCLYTVSLGIQALARSSTVILGILILTLILMCIGAIPQAEPQNLSLSPDDTIWRGFLHSMIHADELPLLFLLLDFTEKKQFRRIIPIWAGKFLMGAYLSVLGMAVLGSRMAHADHPFFAIVSVSQPLSTQRADAIYLLVFVMLCVLRITLFTVLAAHLLRLCFPKLRYTSTVCLLLMLGISWGASAVTVPDFVSLAFLGILVLLIPGLLLFLPERRRQAT
ncbi:MAG: GerAB/ArcD/ProY family transporter, partial [Ruminococcus sp.]